MMKLPKQKMSAGYHTRRQFIISDLASLEATEHADGKAHGLAAFIKDLCASMSMSDILLPFMSR
jgi:hypothetical protein